MGAAAPALAGSFMVTPVRATLSAKQPVAALTVRNESQEATVVQVEVVTWTQREGSDVYAATRDILATPPIFTVAPGASQLVRIGLRRDADPGRELAYRVFLQEVPPPAKSDFRGLRVALRMGIPVFVLPPTAVAPLLQWRAEAAQGGVSLSLKNEGNAHVQLTDLRLVLPAGGELAREQMSTYVLPGQSRGWRFNRSAPAGASLRLSARTDGGDLETDVKVEAR
jgi:fimbrial chaperone protein